MDLSTVDAALILARGQYATVNSEHKTQMSLVQSWTQQACDYLRHALQSTNQEIAQENLKAAAHLCEVLMSASETCAALKDQKDELYQAAWGKK
jgi:methanogenic corrinoid protein MtbC1